MKFSTVKLGDYLYIKGRIGWKGLKKSEYLEQGEYRIINGEALVVDGINWNKAGFITKERYEESPEIMLQEEDILLSKDGTIGKIGFVDKLEQPTTVASGIFVIRNLKPEIINTRFIYYFLCSKYFKDFVTMRTEGSVIPHLYQKDFVDFDFPLPSKEIQRKIVSILDDISSKIDINKEINNNLEQQAKALYKDWFFDFSPFSSNGNLPDGWRFGLVGDIIQLHDSKRVPLSGAERDKMAKVYPYYGATSLMDYVDNYLFDGIYLLLGEDGSVIDKKGFPILQYVEGKFWVNNHAHIITGKNGFSVEQLYLLFSLTNVQSIVTGAVQPKISQTNLKKLPVIIPSEKDLKKFDVIVQPIFAQIRNLRAENNKLSVIRDSLLTKLMSGEIDVSNIDL
ncbi:restriction endonuclease subunit S [Enterococcus cecorum]|uniref:restriction endonuclease subunit S n=2 Tax=Enterococcus cecorum TaxID=44008 RepID=UPI001FAC46B6|nr:restriction endonuclease subunit S [Enterococcus cecorum]MCJ0566674.1 restriction endonuclease subunit S [Enterococcus cecorum]MCJ0594381.1 restriction endonuclease subunit S [Enterococcus cecorum]